MEDSKLFGASLRDIRLRAGKSMGDVARHLDVSTPFIADVEHGRRAPLSVERIERLAPLLGITDIEPLLVAAMQSRRAIAVARPRSTKGQEALAALQRRADHLPDETWDAIRELLEKAARG